MAVSKVHDEVHLVWKDILQQLFFNIPLLGNLEWFCRIPLLSAVWPGGATCAALQEAQGTEGG